MPTARPTVEVIARGDLEEVAEFLHGKHNGKIPVADWIRLLDPPWMASAPNHGFVLRDAGEVVGVYAALYGPPPQSGPPVCHLFEWSVLEPYRLHSIRLLQAILAQPGYLFTDFSPRPHVARISRRFGFADTETTAWLVPGVPLPGAFRVKILTDRDEILAVLDGPDRQTYLDHDVDYGPHQLVAMVGGTPVYVAYLSDRPSRFAPTVIRHTNRPELLRRALPALARHLFRRHGAGLFRVEQQFLPRKPWYALRARTDDVRLARGPEPVRSVHYLYSELIYSPEFE